MQWSGCGNSAAGARMGPWLYLTLVQGLLCSPGAGLRGCGLHPEEKRSFSGRKRIILNG